jgi:diguanylate cyclase (GGDEF)-like protein/PAS domain S-box-containing protein
MVHTEPEVIPEIEPFEALATTEGFNMPLLTGEGPSSAHGLGRRLGVYMGLLVSLRAKHAPTAAHCLRVAHNLSAWGLYFQLPEENLCEIELVGLLHDIGKIGIPERILQKPSQLLPEERSLVELHPQVGLEILTSTGIHSAVSESILKLGAWFDGSNRGNDNSYLSLHQRILSIADAFDAMTSEQPYRRAMKAEVALAELRRLSGRQFDPKLVESFVEVVQNTDEGLRQKVRSRWQDFDSARSLTPLFVNQGTQNSDGSVAIRALHDVFHRKMMDHMNDGVIFVDTEMRILEWNQAAEQMTGIPRTAVLHQEWFPGLVGLSDQRGKAIDQSHCPIRLAMNEGTNSNQRLRLQPTGGTHLKVDVQLMPIFDDLGVLRGGAMLMGDASDQADLEEMVIELHTQASQDPLTKVANRAELDRTLPKFVDTCKSKRRPGCIIICDIDFFKRINDTFGHSAGDEALKVFASVLKNESRESDLVARYGGEEFVILCDNCDLQSAVRVAESIRSRLQRTSIGVLKGKLITASFGVAEVRSADVAEEPLDRADRALLEAKQTGRDRVVTANDHETATEKDQADESNGVGPATSSWLDWFGGGTVTPLVSVDLIASVHRDIVIEKLKGFVLESKANLLSIDADTVHMRVDCRTAPMQRRNNDRPTVFEIKLSLIDVERAGSNRNQGFQRMTQMKVDINPVRNRDRRTEALIDQANRLRLSFQSFLVATELDDTTRKNLIPIYKPGKDGR